MGETHARHAAPTFRLGQLIAWFVMVTVLIVLAVSVLIPRLAGATPYSVLTSSMEPGMPPGTLVVVKPVAPEDIAIGSVIAYQLRSGQPEVVTHRVVAQHQDLTGKISFTTRGDANQQDDAARVMPVQIKGERWYYVPYLGHVTNVLNNSQRQVAIWLLALGLFGYAAVMFAGATRDRRKSATTAREVDDVVQTQS